MSARVEELRPVDGSSRTSLILLAVEAALEPHRPSLDEDSGLQSITITIKMTANSRIPRAAVVSRESSTPLTTKEGTPLREANRPLRPHD